MSARYYQWRCAMWVDFCSRKPSPPWSSSCRIGHAASLKAPALFPRELAPLAAGAFRRLDQSRPAHGPYCMHDWSRSVLGKDPAIVTLRGSPVDHPAPGASMNGKGREFARTLVPGFGSPPRQLINRVATRRLDSVMVSAKGQLPRTISPAAKSEIQRRHRTAARPSPRLVWTTAPTSRGPSLLSTQGGHHE